MKIICNGYNIASEKLVLNLLDCSMPVSLLPDDDYSFKVVFYDKNFDNLLLNTFGDLSIVKKLRLRKELQDKHIELRSAVRGDCFLCLYNEESYEVIHDTRGYNTENWDEESSENVRYGMATEERMKKIKYFIKNFEKESHKDHLKYLKNRNENKTIPSEFIFTEDSLELGRLKIEGKEYKEFMAHVKSYVEEKSPYILNEENYEKLIKYEYDLQKVLTLLKETNCSKWKINDEESMNEAINVLKEVFCFFKTCNDY
jgi:hypothetical protein